MEERQLIDRYLNCSYTAERKLLLQNIKDKKQSLPISLTADLMKLKLTADEHIGILKNTSGKHKLALEDYLSSQLSSWDQNVAATALWEWALRTDCILGHRALPLSLSPLTPQRIRYTLLDLSWFLGGVRLVQELSKMEGLDDMSPAFHALLSFRALQFQVESPKLLARAKVAIEESSQNPHSSDRYLCYFLSYILRFDAAWASQYKPQHSYSGIWTQFLHSLSTPSKPSFDREALKKIFGKSSKKIDEALLMALWPSVWERQAIDSEDLLAVLTALSQQKLPLVSQQSWEFFAGILPSVMHTTLAQCSEPKTFCTGLNLLAPFLDHSQQSSLIDQIKAMVLKSTEPTEILTQLSPRFSALLNNVGAQSVFAKVFEEREQIITAFERKESYDIKGLQLWEREFSSQELTRHAFFSLAYHGKKVAEPSGDDFWTELSLAWQNPSPDRIERISLKARQAPDLYQICFIDTLGRFKGNDTAALKLLDFIRSTEEPILRSIIYALAGIGTVRATQELVAFLTRPNVSPLLQVEISQILKEMDVSHLQAELRSALNDLNFRALTDTVLVELRDAISSLLTVNEPLRSIDTTIPSASPTTLDLDQMLAQKIERYDQLSSEVKRALRTAQFFHLQVEAVGSQLGTIDLSPAIDMQYKALELCFREKFEQPCSDLIRQGILQRKLDVIGYARPIPQAMDDFEDYIERLPIIQSIPFFSRFKLRKMLRAICQFRPGKRFTLDGLKAFAIFFVCFSRSDCRFGLSNLFPITKLSQEQILNFCKELHVFQDFRNRAAHEGFHPDASNNLDSIWKSTASIIQTMFVIAESIEPVAKAPNLKKIV